MVWIDEFPQNTAAILLLQFLENKTGTEHYTVFVQLARKIVKEWQEEEVLKCVIFLRNIIVMCRLTYALSPLSLICHAHKHHPRYNIPISPLILHFCVLLHVYVCIVTFFYETSL
jgi:hypothetical protein